MSYESDRGWSDRFIPQIKPILGMYLIGEATESQDALENTDLIVLTLDRVRIGCRVRRHGYYEEYKNEFTIRANRPSGNKSELGKIVEGWGDYLFYGFADDEGSRLLAWRLLDLSVFRLWFNRAMYKGKPYPWQQIANNDGSSEFFAFDVRSIGEDIEISSDLPM